MEWSRKHDPLLRFEERVTKDESGCWFWQGKLNARGYAAFKINGQDVLGHRWTYETYKGPIPKGHGIDHLCSNRCCVNPDHLEAVTAKENNRRARAHCFQAGHPVTKENSIFLSGGVRACRLCHQERESRYRRRSNQARQRSELLELATRTFLVVAPTTSSDSILIRE